MTLSRKTRWIWGVWAVGLLVVSGCRAEEQGRPLYFTPGVYQGVEDQGLSADQQERLRGRVDQQRF